MKLKEFEAKQLLEAVGINVSKGEIMEAELEGPFYDYICPHCKNQIFINYYTVKANWDIGNNSLNGNCFSCGKSVELKHSVKNTTTVMKVVEKEK